MVTQSFIKQWQERAAKIGVAPGGAWNAGALAPEIRSAVAAGMKDGRGNRAQEAAVIHFSTGDSLAPGRLEGKIITGRLKPQGVMVWAFDSQRCPSNLGETTPEGVGQSDGTGEFSVGALPVGRSYCVYAHYDIDMDGHFEWWLPGLYDPATSPGLDCDDRHDGVFGEGC